MERVGGRGGNRVRFYQAVVEYAYTVRDREYHSTNLSFGAKTAGAQGTAEATAARYPAGADVVVHYDPRSPSNAVVELVVAMNRAGWLLAVVFLGLAVYFSGAFH